jgi:hypothetical protein
MGYRPVVQGEYESYSSSQAAFTPALTQRPLRLSRSFHSGSHAPSVRLSRSPHSGSHAAFTPALTHPSADVRKTFTDLATVLWQIPAL